MHDVRILVTSSQPWLTALQYPETASFLTEDERHYVIESLKEDSKGQATHLDKKFIWQAVLDWKTYFQIINYIG
jgi:hypothetical protein